MAKRKMSTALLVLAQVWILMTVLQQEKSASAYE